MGAINTFWSILMSIWQFMKDTTIINQGGFSITFAELLIWTAFVALIIWCIQMIFYS